MKKRQIRCDWSASTGRATRNSCRRGGASDIENAIDIQYEQQAIVEPIDAG